jgi:hypothetical protein
MSDNFDNLSPHLSIRLNAFSAKPIAKIEDLSEAEFQELWKTSGLKVTPENQTRFNALLDFAKGRQRLEAAKQLLIEKQPDSTWKRMLEASIAALSLDEVLKQLRDSLSMPGVAPQVYARKLEETSEADLRSMLFDLERTKRQSGQGKDNTSTGHSA